jgi:hypothetical protein
MMWGTTRCMRMFLGAARPSGCAPLHTPAVMPLGVRRTPRWDVDMASGDCDGPLSHGCAADASDEDWIAGMLGAEDQAQVLLNS